MSVYQILHYWLCKQYCQVCLGYTKNSFDIFIWSTRWLTHLWHRTVDPERKVHFYITRSRVPNLFTICKIRKIWNSLMQTLCICKKTQQIVMQSSWGTFRDSKNTVVIFQVTNYFKNKYRRCIRNLQLMQFLFSVKIRSIEFCTITMKK